MKRCRYPFSVAASLTVVVAVFVLGMPMAARAQSCTANTASDWMSGALAQNPLAQDIRPHDCDTVLQTPPDFRWPDVISTGGYTITLTYPDGSQHSQPAVQNWANWAATLAPRTYKWSVSYAGGTPSATRRHDGRYARAANRFRSGVFQSGDDRRHTCALTVW